MTTHRYASLCSGIGGLDLAVETVFGCELAWHSEYAAEPAAVHERHWPGVPNHGDLTAIDWAAMPTVDLVCAGYPCQPFSHAGARKGEQDERHLWPHINEAVRVLRPRWVVLENVAGHLSLGFGTVLGDLAAAGYDAEWCCVRASDVGAPHNRLRLFVVAQNTSGVGDRSEARDQVDRPDRSGSTGGVSGPDNGTPADTQRREGGQPDRRDLLGRRPGEAEQTRLGGGDPSADTDGQQPERRGTTGHLARPGRSTQGAPRQRQRRGDAATDRREAHPDTDRLGREGAVAEPRRHHGRSDPGPDTSADPERVGRRPRPGLRPDGPAGKRWRRPDNDAGPTDWGPYTPAVHRWERLTRLAPRPTDTRGRLDPDFVEWMMGYPEGWTAELKRGARLKALGNAVVPQQGTFALSLLVDAWTLREEPISA